MSDDGSFSGSLKSENLSRRLRPLNTVSLLTFIPERFGCEEWELFTSILCSIDAHIERKREDLFIKGFGWLGFR